jgi:hypothetical protein
LQDGLTFGDLVIAPLSSNSSLISLRADRSLFDQSTPLLEVLNVKSTDLLASSFKVI